MNKPPSSYERLMESLRLDGLVPTAAQGGGKGSVEFESDHIAAWWLGLPSPRPSLAAKLVRQLDALPFRGSKPQGYKASGQHLGSALGGYLEQLAGPFSRGEQLNPELLKAVESWQLSICLEPLAAQISMNVGDSHVTYYFTEENTLRAPMFHVVMFSGEMWSLFSTLLANTYIRQNAVRAIQFLDATKPAKLGQGQENAGSLPQEPASSTSQFPPQEPAPLNNQSLPGDPEGSPPRKLSSKSQGIKDAPLAGLVTIDE
ncbi:MAG: hypothetical protein ACRYHQ_12295 [Janthinobacterium lividum]